jgi:outer membrane protein assembly factor BamB
MYMAVPVLLAVAAIFVGTTVAHPHCDAAPGTQLWKFPTAGAANDPFYFEDRVYLSGGETLYSVDAMTGTAVWQRTFPVSSHPRGKIPHVTSTGYVYISAVNGSIVALNSTNGADVWHFQTQDDPTWYSSNPVPSVDLTLIFTNNEHYLYALDATNGTKVWSVPCVGSVTAGVGYVGGVSAVFVTTKTHFTAREASNGNAIWETPNLIPPTGRATGPLATTTRVFTCVHYATLTNIVALDIVTGAVVFNTSLPGTQGPGHNTFGTHIIEKFGIVYASSCNQLWAIDGATGAIRWARLGDDTGITLPFVHAGVVFHGSDSGKLFAASASNGRTLWTFQTESDVWSDPMASGNVAFTGSQDKHLYGVCMGRLCSDMVSNATCASDAQRGQCMWCSGVAGNGTDALACRPGCTGLPCGLYRDANACTLRGVSCEWSAAAKICSAPALPEQCAAYATPAACARVAGCEMSRAADGVEQCTATL